MGKILIVAEKPDAAINIAKAVNCLERKDGYFENAFFVITWAVGHLVRQKMPEEHNQLYKSWRLEDLPFEFPEETRLCVNQATAKQYNIIKNLIHRPDIDVVYNGGDAGREGLLIQMWIYRMAGNKKPVKHIWSDSLTEEKLKKCIFSPKEDTIEFKRLLDEAEARAIGDYDMGINISRLLTLIYGTNQTVVKWGRCKGRTLDEIVQRDMAIENFKPETFYRITPETELRGSIIKWGVYNDNNEKVLYDTEQEAEAAVRGLRYEMVTVQRVVKEEKHSTAPLLFNLAKLQAYMGTNYEFTPTKTLDICQALYEKKILSYPRTDSQYLSSDVMNELDRHVASINFGAYSKIVEKINRVAPKKYCNDKKVVDHHALIPTINNNIEEIYNGLSGAEKCVYDVICKRFLAIFMHDYVCDSTIVNAKWGEFNLQVSGKVTKHLGWKELLGNNKEEEQDKGEEKEQILPSFIEGMQYRISNAEVKKVVTSAPPHYTTAALIEYMEKHSIGTSATRNQIIDELQDIKSGKNIYIYFDGKKYVSTTLGRKVCAVIPEELKSIEFVQKFEENLQAIGNGELSKEEFLSKIHSDIRMYVEKYTNMQETVSIDRESCAADDDMILKCPRCKGVMRKHLKGWGCSNFRNETNKCNFFISQPFASKTLSDTIVKELVEKGVTRKLKNFVGKNGKFDACLYIAEDWTVKFKFDSKSKSYR